MRIAIDAMGGDHAPGEIVAGAVEWSRKNQGNIILVGQEEVLKKELESYTYSPEQITIVHASQVVGMDESPAVALRRKKDSSIVIATQLVKTGQADAIVSCGSTGAQMAAAIFILGRMENIERPPIVTPVPNQKGGYTLLIDVGANVDCRPRQLLQFAQLGSAYAKVIMGIDGPRIGLLNNGEEEGKGNSLAVESYALLKAEPGIRFAGNVEGRDLFSDRCDVLVCDGFTGNVLLKAMEGVASFLGQACYQEFGKLPAVFERFDYSKIGGAPLLGVDGISIVCHGSSKREAVENGLNIAADCAGKDIVRQQKLALGLSI